MPPGLPLPEATDRTHCRVKVPSGSRVVGKMVEHTMKVDPMEN